MNKPYFETKVIKVKKDEEWIVGNAVIDDKTYPIYRNKRDRIYFKSRTKDNWVNGENLDKIKFPCFCSYNGDQYGIITKTYIGEGKDPIHTLHSIQRQFYSLSSKKSYSGLRKLIKAFDIHILKGKIIIFEEEKEEEYSNE